MSWTIKFIHGISKQLYATSQMALQNRFVIDRQMAEEQGACNYFRDECCTEIPQFAGEPGNVTKLL